VLLAEGLAVEKTDPHFAWGIALMLFLYIVAGTHAGWFMGATINTRWESDSLEEFNERAFDPIRRFMHHWMYWAGVVVGLFGIFFAYMVPNAKDL
jgi:flagellar biosynthesis protein FliP